MKIDEEVLMPLVKMAKEEVFILQTKVNVIDRDEYVRRTDRAYKALEKLVKILEGKEVD